MNSKVGLFSVIIVLTLFGNANAQTGSFTFEQEKAHVLYGSYMENLLKISGSSKFDSLTVEYDYYNRIWADTTDRFGNIIVLDSSLVKSRGDVTKGTADKTYIIKVSAGVNAKLNFHLDGKIIESRIYKIIDVPKPILKFGNANSSDDEITLEELLKIKSLICEKIDWEYDEQYEVYGFEFKCIGPGKFVSQNSSSASLTTRMTEALSKVAVGDEITFCNIRAALPGQGAVIVPSVRLKVVN